MKIAVQDEQGRYRNLNEIVTRADGGFEVSAPCHSAKEGFLCKAEVDAQRGTLLRADLAERAQRYSSTDRVKLVFHNDGFVQFASENAEPIFSERNASGEVSGLGIVSGPLSKAVGKIRFGILAWGLNAFEEYPAPDCQSEANIKFQQKDFYNRGMRSGVDRNGIAIEGVLFHSGFWEAVRGKPPDLHLEVAARAAHRLGLATVDVRVVPLENPDVFIGIFANHLEIRLKPPSGFQLSAAPGPDHWCLLATYPEPGHIPTEASSGL